MGIVCIGAPSLRNCPGARRPPGEDPAATQKVSGACLSPSLIMGDPGQNPAVWSTRALPMVPPPHPELLERRGDAVRPHRSGPWVLCKLDTPLVITGLPGELGAATLGRIQW